HILVIDHVNLLVAKFADFPPTEVLLPAPGTRTALISSARTPSGSRLSSRCVHYGCSLSIALTAGGRLAGGRSWPDLKCLGSGPSPLFPHRAFRRSTPRLLARGPARRLASRATLPRAVPLPPAELLAGQA